MIRWLLARPGPGLDTNNFLCLSEVHEGRRYRHPGRYRQWLLGRAAAKTLLERHAQALGLEVPSPKSIQVRRTQEGWPQPLAADGEPIPVSLSIAHTGDKALCVLCPDREGTVGADIEVVALRPEHFLEDFYTDEERRNLSRLPEDIHSKSATVIWCIKEAVLKARRAGFHESAKSVSVLSLGLSPSQTWHEAEVGLTDAGMADVWWRLTDNETIAMAIARIPTG